MTERPNKRALVDALDIYRDAMRPFIVRILRRARGRSVEDCIASALRDDHYAQFELSLSEGKSVEDSIDINHFSRIVKAHWWEVFRRAFEPESEVRELLSIISRARNKASHPDSHDIDLIYTENSLSMIASVLAEINDPDQSQAVENIRRSLLPFSTVAHRFRQGGRDVYAFALDLETLDNLLPERVDESVVKDANRPLTTSHAKNIQKYLEQRDDWLLGSLLLGISPDAVAFQPFGEEDAERSVGELRIQVDDISGMKMFDGQHRRRAIGDALKDISLSNKGVRELSALKEASVPVMVFAEDSIEALRQMFADAAKTRTIERNTVTRFDQTDAFNLAALRLVEESDLFGGRVEMERSTVPRNSHNIIAINQLAMTLKTMEVGYGGRVSKSRNDEYMMDLESLYDRCLTWSDDFMPAARIEYNDLMAGEVDNIDIPDKRTETMAYNATVIRILAGCFYKWQMEFGDWKPLANFLREALLKPGVVSGSLLVEVGLVAPGGTSPIAQRQAMARAIDYIVRQARELSS